jgi:hypothetical protein
MLWINDCLIGLNFKVLSENFLLKREYSSLVRENIHLTTERKKKSAEYMFLWFT